MPATTFLGIPRAGQAGIVAAFTGVGVTVGWFLPTLVGWALDLPWVPFRGLLRLIDSAPDPWLHVGTTALGLLIGGWIGVTAIIESLAVTVTDQQVELRINGTTRTFTRDRIAAVFLDEKRLVLLDPTTRVLAREKPESSAAALATGFRAHGYPWTDADPYLGHFRLWVPDTPGLPDGVNALLTARSRAIEKKQKDDVSELNQEVSRLGVVVRDEGTRQYWRRVPRAP